MIGKMASKARAGLTFLRHLLRTPDRYWAGRLAARKIPYGAARLDRASGRLRLGAASLLLGREHEFILGGYHDAASLAAAGARFSPDSEGDREDGRGPEDGRGQVRVEVGGLRFIVQTAEELYILNEIFVNGIYNLRTAEQVVVWDIGMNVGIASLYFASRPEVAHVVAYEPFAPTYRQALKNIGLNTGAGRKITPFNVGIGDSERSVRVAYRYDIKGSVGINGLPADAGEDGAAQERLDMRPAAAVLEELAAAHPGLGIIAKVDCEGAEYEIIRSLADADSLTRIQAFLIEWHTHGPGEIVGLLADAGFTTLSLLPQSAGTGMIYAVRAGGCDA